MFLKKLFWAFRGESGLTYRLLQFNAVELNFKFFWALRDTLSTLKISASVNSSLKLIVSSAENYICFWHVCFFWYFFDDLEVDKDSWRSENSWRSPKTCKRWLHVSTFLIPVDKSQLFWSILLTKEVTFSILLEVETEVILAILLSKPAYLTPCCRHG